MFNFIKRTRLKVFYGWTQIENTNEVRICFYNRAMKYKCIKIGNYLLIKPYKLLNQESE
jgi:hypothetical protein